MSLPAHPCQRRDSALFAFCDHPECDPTKGAADMAASPISSLFPGTPPTGPAGASSANRSPSPSGVRVFLRGGSHFDLIAEDVTVKYAATTGKFCRLEWTGGTSGLPMYLNVDAVDAVIDLDGIE
jgi:hypothetical protein